jgi:hypothetical protein
LAPGQVFLSNFLQFFLEAKLDWPVLQVALCIGERSGKLINLKKSFVGEFILDPFN